MPQVDQIWTVLSLEHIKYSRRVVFGSPAALSPKLSINCPLHSTANSSVTRPGSAWNIDKFLNFSPHFQRQNFYVLPIQIRWNGIHAGRCSLERPGQKSVNSKILLSAYGSVSISSRPECVMLFLNKNSKQHFICLVVSKRGNPPNDSGHTHTHKVTTESSNKRKIFH